MKLLFYDITYFPNYNIRKFTIILPDRELNHEFSMLKSCSYLTRLIL